MKRVKTFAEIDETYSKYLRSVSGNNNTSHSETLKSQIIEELWCTLHSNTKYARLLNDYPDEMIETCVYWLQEYSKNNDYHGFTACTFKYLKMKLNSCAANDSFDDSTAGMHVTVSYRDKQRALKQLYKTFFGFTNNIGSQEELNNKFIDYACKFLSEKKITKSDVIDFLYPQQKIAMDTKSKDESENEFDITDFFGGSKLYSSSKTIEDEERLKIIMTPINEKWKLQKSNSQELLSELLTVIIMDAIENHYISIGNNSEEFISDTISKYDFISKFLISKYLNGSLKSLPSQQEIGDRYNLTKSAVSVKIKRFFEDLNIAQILSDYDKENL